MITNIKGKIKLPGLELEGTWEPNDSEKKAAWEMYVELITRVTIAELKPGDGTLREALSSLHSLFPKTRDILCRYGPSLAQSSNSVSFGYIAVSVLNYVLRPILSIWHPLLSDYENKRESAQSVIEHEKNWEFNPKLRMVLNEARTYLIQYANLLAEVAQVPILHPTV
jgi:hypothetical protein